MNSSHSQAVDKLRLVESHPPARVVQATHDEHTAPTVVASVQTLSRRTRLAARAGFSDQLSSTKAHTAPAPHVPAHPRLLPGLASRRPPRGGVTAHPEGATATPLREVLSDCYQKPCWRMMQAGYLVDLRALQVWLQADFIDALRPRMAILRAELESLLSAANAPAQVLAASSNACADRKALLFTPPWLA